MRGWRSGSVNVRLHSHRERGRQAWRRRLYARLGILPLLAALAIAFAGCPCKTDPAVVGRIVIDCLVQDQAKIGSLAAELLPLLQGDSPDWATFEQKAKDAGVNIGGCVAADLINRYLAPPPGNAAPSPENGQAARDAMDRIRATFGGASFKTAQGEL